MKTSKFSGSFWWQINYSERGLCTSCHFQSLKQNKKKNFKLSRKPSIFEIILFLVHTSLSLSMVNHFVFSKLSAKVQHKGMNVGQWNQTTSTKNWFSLHNPVDGKTQAKHGLALLELRIREMDLSIYLKSDPDWEHLFLNKSNNTEKLWQSRSYDYNFWL